MPPEFCRLHVMAETRRPRRAEWGNYLLVPGYLQSLSPLNALQNGGGIVCEFSNGVGFIVMQYCVTLKAQGFAVIH
jgi:hypothetical protein